MIGPIISKDEFGPRRESSLCSIPCMHGSLVRVEQEDHLVFPRGTRNFHLSGDSGLSSKCIVILLREIWWSTSDQH